MAVEVIPGLPNELAMEVLLRLHSSSHPAAIQASALWRIVLSSDRFYIQRRRRFPYPALLLALTDNICNFVIEEIDLVNPSCLPRRLFSFEFPEFVKGDVVKAPGFSACLPDDCFIVLDVHVWSEFHLLCSVFAQFQGLKPLPPMFTDKQQWKIVMMGLHGGSPFVIVERRDFCSKAFISYDTALDAWVLDDTPGFSFNVGDTFHYQGLSINVGYTFHYQGQLRFRSGSRTLAFNPTTSKWEEDTYLTKRLGSETVVGMDDGTLFKARISRSDGQLPRSALFTLEKQQKNSWKWCIVLKTPTIATSQRFFLHSNGKELIVILPDFKYSEDYWSECHPIEGYNVRFVCVPCRRLRAALLIHG